MITVIGAGPAGSYVSYLLAKAGKEVTLVEEHEEIGKPVQCTGIVTESISEFIDLRKEVIANKMSRVKVISKNNAIHAKTNEIVMWRNKFDQQVADMAEKEGVTILKSHKFVGMERKNKKYSVQVKDKNHDVIRDISCDALIGADGPSSPVAKAAGIPHHNQFYIGMQAKVKHRMPKEEFETHFGSDYPDFFGWVVPEGDEMVRLGIGCKENAQQYFYRFLEKVTGKKDVSCWESGIIPIYNPKQAIQKDNVYLIGDAATQVKATTGGGIIPSLKAAHTLADCIINGKNYNWRYKMQSGKELWAHLKVRNTLNKFTDSDYDELLMLMSKPRVQKLLSKYDRDTPLPLLFNLAWQEPRFFRFSSVLLR